MWVILNDAMLSIVEKDNQPAGTLTVRARIGGDINRVFPQAVEIVGAGSDYQYRATVLRSEVVKALTDRVNDLHYSNFKNTVRDHDRHSAYLRVWSALHAWQESMVRRSKQAMGRLIRDELNRG